MNDDYRTAAERLINRLRGQGTRPLDSHVEMERPIDDVKSIIINNPVGCTVIVNHHGGTAGNKEQS